MHGTFLFDGKIPDVQHSVRFCGEDHTRPCCAPASICQIAAVVPGLRKCKSSSYDYDVGCDNDDILKLP